MQIVFIGDGNHHNIRADLAIQALRQLGLLVAPESLAGDLELLQVLKMADWLGFETGDTDSIKAGRKLHKLVRQVLDDNPDTPVAELRIWYHYAYAGERAAPEPSYSQDFIELRHAIVMRLVSRWATVKEEDLTLNDCKLIILEAGEAYYKLNGHGITPKQIKED